MNAQEQAAALEAAAATARAAAEAAQRAEEMRHKVEAELRRHGKAMGVRQ